ncbi:hypothetical protein AEA09_15065 [Lysinibacillus contaminans]|uniref:Uncharacterized protein n=1 Tax=Lysinibacillus contaminans TaxID=1293441 RepID=A0ABR5JXZ1_9BACI|nr:hypothetical protein [Lysinibacillus contaminans]KOS67167.1 hypothetical protein AEA09_15065 [Lysinibacillus contaminans]
MMKDPYDCLSGGLAFVFIDLHINGALFDILPDFIGFAFLVYGIHLLPSFHNLKRWSKSFAIILTVMSFGVEVDKWLETQLFGEIGVQLMQFLLIVFMYYVFQLLLHIHENKQLESKTFKTYQKFMPLMLCGFVIQSFVINTEPAVYENLHILGAALQLIAFILFSMYCRAGTKHFKETAESTLRY